MADFKVSVCPLRGVDRGDSLLITGHELLKLRLIICRCRFTRLKGWRFGGLLHGVPVHSVGGLHDRMRGVRLVVVGAVVPHGGSAVRRSGLDGAVIHCAENRTVRGVREAGRHLRRLAGAAAKLRDIVKGSGGGPACHLVPLAAIGCGDQSMRRFGLLKLRGIEHLH